MFRRCCVFASNGHTIHRFRDSDRCSALLATLSCIPLMLRGLGKCQGCYEFESEACSTTWTCILFTHRPYLSCWYECDKPILTMQKPSRHSRCILGSPSIGDMDSRRAWDLCTVAYRSNTVFRQRCVFASNGVTIHQFHDSDRCYGLLATLSCIPWMLRGLGNCQGC